MDYILMDRRIGASGPQVLGRDHALGLVRYDLSDIRMAWRFPTQESALDFRKRAMLSDVWEPVAVEWRPHRESGESCWQLAD